MSLVAWLLPGAAQADPVLGGHVYLECALAHHVVDDAGEDPFQFDLSGGEQVMQMPALGGAGPAFPTAVRSVLLEHDDPFEGLE